MRKKESVTPLTETEALVSEIQKLKQQVAILSQTGVVVTQAIDKNYYIFPNQGEIEWNYPNARGYLWHDHRWWPLMPPTHCIKLQKDTEETLVTEDNFTFPVTRDMDGFYLIDAEAAIKTSGSINLGLRNNTQGGASLLSANLIVNSGQQHTRFSTPKRVINTSHQVEWGDQLEVTVNSVGGSAMGASVQLTFSGKPLPRDLDA